MKEKDDQRTEGVRYERIGDLFRCKDCEEDIVGYGKWMVHDMKHRLKNFRGML